QPAYGLRGAGPTASAGRADRLLLRGVAALQTALTLALLVGAGLLIRTVSNLAKVRPGYNTDKILTMSVTDSRLLKFFDFHDQALARISALPGVKHVAFAWGLPLTGNKWMTTAKIQGQRDTDKLDEKLTVPSRSVTPEYFELLAQKILAGRHCPPTHSTQPSRIFLPELAIDRLPR